MVFFFLIFGFEPHAELSITLICFIHVGLLIRDRERKRAKRNEKKWLCMYVFVSEMECFFFIWGGMWNRDGKNLEKFDAMEIQKVRGNIRIKYLAN